MLKKLSKSVFVLVILSVFCFSSAAAAEDNGMVYKSGFYLGVQGNYLSLSGDDFNGLTYLYSYDETMFIPEVDPGIGFGGLIGYREGSLGLEFSFITASLDGTVLTEPVETTLTLFNLYCKFWFNETSPFQPYLLLGVDLSMLNSADSSIENYYPYSIGDTDLTGVNLDAGAGFSYYVTPEVALNAGVNIHFVLFTNVSGVYEEDYELDETITATLLNVNFGVTFTL